MGRSKTPASHFCFQPIPRQFLTCPSGYRRRSVTRPTTLRSAIWMATANMRSCCIRWAAAATTAGGTTTEPILQAYKLDGTLLVANQPGPEHPRRGPLHAVHGLRPGRRRPGRGRLQDGRRHDRWPGQDDRRRRGRSSQRARLRPGRARVSHRVRRPHRRGAGHGRLPAAARRGARLGATTTATASIASWPASPIWTASGRAW